MCSSHQTPGETVAEDQGQQFESAAVARPQTAVGQLLDRQGTSPAHVI